MIAFSVFTEKKKLVGKDHLVDLDMNGKISFLRRMSHQQQQQQQQPR